MVRIMSRDDFVRSFDDKRIDVNQLKSDQCVKRTLPKSADAQTGLSALAAADLDGDGFISGEKEFQKLFDQVDAFDAVPGDNRLVTVDEKGERTTPGKLAIHLDRLAAPLDAAKGDWNAGAKAGAIAIQANMKEHADKLRDTGVGKYFGDHSGFGAVLDSNGDVARRTSAQEKLAWLSNKFSNASPEKLREMQKSLEGPGHESSCIGWAMENVGEAYKAAGKEARWKEIEGIVRANGSRGTVLAQELQKDGWKGIYWNPDSKHPDSHFGKNGTYTNLNPETRPLHGDREPCKKTEFSARERQNDPVMATHCTPGEHISTASKTDTSYGTYCIRIDDRVMDYRPNAWAGKGRPTQADTAGLKKLEKVPFYFGLTEGGNHTFVGRNGSVVEFHYDRDPTQRDAVEETPLYQWGMQSGLKWQSGVILVPPNAWPTER